MSCANCSTGVHNLGLTITITITMAGAGLPWVGWFGFNAGSAVASDGRAGLAVVVTHIAASAGAIGWMFGKWIVRGRPSLPGLFSGLLAGRLQRQPVAPPNRLEARVKRPHTPLGRAAHLGGQRAAQAVTLGLVGAQEARAQDLA